MKGFFHL